MWGSVNSVSDSLGHVLFFLTVIVCARAVVQRISQQRRERREAKRLRLILYIGFREMHALYADNLRSLATGDRVLLSGSGRSQLLRPHLARLTALDRDIEIRTVMAANFAIEAAEAAMAMAGRPVRGAAFALARDGVRIGTLEPLLMRACAALEEAAALLAPPLSHSEAAKTWFAAPFARPVTTESEAAADRDAVQDVAKQPAT
jgi:hypothetical protein